ncbi:protein-glutamate O-methyltransferase [Endozoicomonas sp. SM1973]|uniref:Chemotaxis protein methyltransferase n=1 Tax=Spartinivicinus marinus TaxID=2994442 RepID=A0A853IF89_9GAMM|nr:protein-glutamate O-methyltransferase [Spartinivicinus marinus]MCX4028168.1 protein-glutamate O-methyltransferase [Spartinivicinus marinus]NYZ66156.1 protein-glutamate O-methyltransferase [Spartinivicinus marinus]
MTIKVNNDYLGREFPMSDNDFAFIQKTAYNISGITLHKHKKNMIYGRLARRLRSLKLKNFSQYCDLLKKENNKEHKEFVNAITTNLTYFFREPHHFDFLKKTALPLIIRHHQHDKRIRIWSAGCSTGEEPYSIAIIMREMINPGWSAKLLATDVDSNVLNCARTGLYRPDQIKTISSERQKKWFSYSAHDNKVKVKKSVQKIITFNQLNLLHNWPMKGKFDIIFCRNVMIYFDRDTRNTLINRYVDILRPNGYLYIGHAENLHNNNHFKPLGYTIYQRVN